MRYCNYEVLYIIRFPPARPRRILAPMVALTPASVGICRTGQPRRRIEWVGRVTPCAPRSVVPADPRADLASPGPARRPDGVSPLAEPDATRTLSKFQFGLPLVLSAEKRVNFGKETVKFLGALPRGAAILRRRARSADRRVRANPIHSPAPSSLAHGHLPLTQYPWQRSLKQR